MRDWLINLLANVVAMAMLLGVSMWGGLNGLLLFVGALLIYLLFFRIKYGRYPDEPPGVVPDDGIVGNWLKYKLQDRKLRM